MVNYIIEIEKFLKTPKNNIEEIFEYQINKNIKIWLQYYAQEYYLEIQFKKENDKEFGEYIINLNYYLDDLQSLESLIQEYTQEIEKNGIKKFLTKHKEEFI